MIKPRPWPWIEFFSSRGQESQRLFMGQQQHFSISNFLEEISSLSHSIVFLYFFALITEEGFLIYPCYSLELCIQMSIFSFFLSFLLIFFSQLFVRPPQTAFFVVVVVVCFFISFSWAWSCSLSPVQCHETPPIVHQALCLSDLVP